jgi:hypothetical protein
MSIYDDQTLKNIQTVDSPRARFFEKVKRELCGIISIDNVYRSYRQSFGGHVGCVGFVNQPNNKPKKLETRLYRNISARV